MAKDKSEYAPSAAQVDAEERRDNENRSSRVLTTADAYEPPEEDEGREYAVEGNDLDGYIGVNPEYMTYANETEKPLVGDGVDDEIADQFVETMQQGGIKEESDEDEGDDSDSEEDSGASDPGQSGPPPAGSGSPSSGS